MYPEDGGKTVLQPPEVISVIVTVMRTAYLFSVSSLSLPLPLSISFFFAYTCSHFEYNVPSIATCI
jgi:hypothetical protein